MTQASNQLLLELLKERFYKLSNSKADLIEKQLVVKTCIELGFLLSADALKKEITKYLKRHEVLSSY